MSDLAEGMPNAVIQLDSLNQLHGFVVNALSGGSIGALAHKALLSFEASVKKHNIEALDEDGLRLWIVDMILAGLKQTTRRRYFNNIHTLCRSAYDFSSSDPFENVRKYINNDYDADLKQINDNLNLVKRMVLQSASIGQNIERNEYVDIFLCLLYDVDATIDSVINFNFDESHDKLPQIEDIVDKYRGQSRTKYVFGLRQRQMRNTQIGRDIISRLYTTLTDHGMRFGGTFSRDSIRELWIAAALRCGISTTEIAAVSSSLPKNYSFLETIKPADISASRKAEIIRIVADYINDNKKYWYAMQLRSGKTPDDIKNTLKTKEYPRFGEIGFYYPTHTTIKKKGKKMKKEVVPYLPGVLFFYVKRDEVKTLFGQYIGDEAWCYRYANHPDSPYSAISRREMERFQRQVGSFTPDVEMKIVEMEQEANVGDEVRIIGGDVFEGQEGKVTKVKKVGNKLFYSIRLTNSLCINWAEMDVPAVFTEPITR